MSVRSSPPPLHREPGPVLSVPATTTPMKAAPLTPSRQALLTLGVVLSLVASSSGLQAGPLEKLLRKDVDVITVTDLTDAGQDVRAATPAEPVRYLPVYAGEIPLGLTWAGDSIPPNQVAMQWLMSTLKTQGYLPADDKHPAEQVLIFGWARHSPEGGTLRTVGFLGGTKTNLIKGRYEFGRVANAELDRLDTIRTHLEHKIVDFSGSDLYLGIVRAYARDSLDTPKPVKLWETRFGCRATGLVLDETMPLMLKAAALNFGRETTRPVNLNASDNFGGRVILGDLEVLGEYKAPAEADLPARARDLAVEMTKSEL